MQWGSVLELESFCQQEATLKADNNDFQYQIDVCQNTSAAHIDLLIFEVQDWSFKAGGEQLHESLDSHYCARKSIVCNEVT